MAKADHLHVPAEAREAILVWYGQHGRTLAFRETADPWAILVSEVIAQQTHASRAADRWESFMARFPTVHALAGASAAEVLRVWQGLGYDRRGLRLHRAAQAIATVHGGRVPSSIDALMALPGIGPYTARAVAAIAFGEPVGAVDVNVRRVLGRMVAGDPDASGTAAMQSLADASVPRGQAAAWTHAVMDLGATVCRPRNPHCEACPVRAWCRFAAAATTKGDPAEAPPASATASRRTVPFPDTNRWLRGRILDRLRAAPDRVWVTIEPPIGGHAADRVLAAVTAMAADGLLEVDRDAAGGLDAFGSLAAPIRARLPA